MPRTETSRKNLKSEWNCNTTQLVFLIACNLWLKGSRRWEEELLREDFTLANSFRTEVMTSGSGSTTICWNIHWTITGGCAERSWPFAHSGCFLMLTSVPACCSDQWSFSLLSHLCTRYSSYINVLIKRRSVGNMISERRTGFLWRGHLL